MTTGKTTGKPNGNPPVPEHSHLDDCAACREVDELWNELAGKEVQPGGQDGPRTISNADLAAGMKAGAAGAQEAAGSGTLLGKRTEITRKGSGGELPEANRCTQCGKWKRPQYETCFDCSGLVLCGNCGENYHDAQYEVCYNCGRSRWEDDDWE